MQRDKKSPCGCLEGTEGLRGKETSAIGSQCDGPAVLPIRKGIPVPTVRKLNFFVEKITSYPCWE
jgi:hypothetical protein